jgi:glycosyltransferase involved in cell wall biosynthesis
MSRVSVIIPTYNQGNYLRQAIQSVLAQSYADFEVIVVDDGSTDNTSAVVGDLSDPRLRYARQANGGLSSARNTGIRNATGSFLSYLDSDDLFLPEKLRLLVALLEENPNLGLVAGQAVLIDETGQSLGEVFDKGLPEDSSQLLLGNPLHVGSVLLRREWQERAGFFDEGLRSYEDWDMWLRLARAGCPMASVSQPVSLYRFHAAQMTRIGDQMTQATFSVLEKIYREPALPEKWESMRDDAYSRAYLRAAAQAYTAKEFSRATAYMREAVRLSPELGANNAERLAQLVAGWANHVKTTEPLTFLEGIYHHLPDELSALRSRRRRDLAREAMQLGFDAHQRGDSSRARAALWQAIWNQPQLLANRGVLSISLRTWLFGSGGERVAS